MRKLLAASTCLLLTCAVRAGGDTSDGHSHGAEATPAAPTISSTPRVVMESSQFELVGALEGQHLHLYLDDYASNAPVTDATLELEINGQRITTAAETDGSYHATLPQPLPEGTHPVMATILAGNASDLLTGQLEVHPAETDTHDHAAATSTGQFLPWLISAGVIGLALLVFALRRDRQRRVNA